MALGSRSLPCVRVNLCDTFLLVELARGYLCEPTVDVPARCSLPRSLSLAARGARAAAVLPVPEAEASRILEATRASLVVHRARPQEMVLVATLKLWAGRARPLQQRLRRFQLVAAILRAVLRQRAALNRAPAGRTQPAELSLSAAAIRAGRAQRVAVE